MTDRYNSLTVVLDHDIRDDDAESLIDAIKQLRSVLSVEGHIPSGIDSHVAEMRVKSELRRIILENIKLY